MSELREAAQAALTAYEKFRDVDDIDGLDDAIDRLRAALAQPETEAQTVAWQWRYILPAGPSGWLDRGSEHDWHDVPAEDVAHYANRSDVEVRPLYAHPPRDEWRPASEPPEDGRRVLIWVAPESREGTFRPAYCPVGGWTSVFDGETLVAWRDINPPTEGAK